MITQGAPWSEGCRASNLQVNPHYRMMAAASGSMTLS
jgi:hypothetical protein